MIKNRITDLFGIKYPIVAGGMVWCSGWRLASAVSNSGGLGLLGAGSMHLPTLEEHIRKCKAATSAPFGVNIPMFYPQIEELIDMVIREGVKIVFTSAGNPAIWTPKLKEAGITVVHVVSSSKFAVKAQGAGVDAVVAEGFEAGGHNGREETTTMVLIPAVCKAVDIPVIAAGGISSGRTMMAAQVLGAEGVQIGTRFALSAESSASEEFKRRRLSLPEGDTMLCLKKIGGIRMIKNDVYQRIKEAEDRGAGVEELKEIVGMRRPKRGIFEGDLNEGMLEIGEVASLIDKVETVQEIFDDILGEYTLLDSGD